MERVIRLFRPHTNIPKTDNLFVWAFWCAVLLFIWQFLLPVTLPRPLETLIELKRLWDSQGLAHELWSSYKVQILAITYGAVISLVIAYLTTLPVMRPLAKMLSVLRFLSLGAIVVFLTLAFMLDAHNLKLSLLTIGIGSFYLTGMLQVVEDVSKQNLDYARSMRMGPWESTWEQIILGKADQAVALLRQNAAMGWMMLTMVEGLVRGEGGVGTLLLNEGKHFNLQAIAAIILVLMIIALLQDFAFRLFEKWAFPYAFLSKERQ